MTDDELNAIRKNADKAGLNVSRYARQRMLIQPVTTALPEDYYRLRADISGLCNNVNQIARAVNTRAREPTKAAEETALYARRAYDLVNEIRERIGHGV